MAIFYVIAGLVVIIINIENVPAGFTAVFQSAIGIQPLAGGVAGTITASMMNAMRFGVARGVFSNEAGMGSAAITAAAATTDNHVRQGCMNMTGTFYDTIVVCTISRIMYCKLRCTWNNRCIRRISISELPWTIAAFSTALGKWGAYLVTIGIALFAFSTILGWEYHGEKAFEYILANTQIQHDLQNIVFFNCIHRSYNNITDCMGFLRYSQCAYGYSELNMSSCFKR